MTTSTETLSRTEILAQIDAIEAWEQSQLRRYSVSDVSPNRATIDGPARKGQRRNVYVTTEVCEPGERVWHTGVGHSSGDGGFEGPRRYDYTAAPEQIRHYVQLRAERMRAG